MFEQERLQSTLLKLDGAGYKAYQDLKGSYRFTQFTLVIDRVQGDPFARPSQVRLLVPQTVAQFPPSLYQSSSREIALRDYIHRQFEKVAKPLSRRRGTGKSGLIAIAAVGQEVLERTSVLIDGERLEVRFWVGLPASGRRILGRQAIALLCEDVPEIVASALIYSSLNPQEIQQQVETVEDADWLRQQLPSKGLVAFVPNDAILPRRTGVDARPLLEAIPWRSPPSLEVAFTCPNRGAVKGMGIPAGITLIVGGGYHGKSTLLQAIELGVYNHVPGDGRELVVAEATAVKICAENGRSIAGVNISPFINELPQGRSTQNFSTPNASGSTSQAANIVEALEAGTQLLLVDEDTAATNFMIRDRRMQQLISKDKEPITPLIDKIRSLYTDLRVSTLLVMGGSGDYFEVADTVIAMENFRPRDVTAQAQQIAQQYATGRLSEGGKQFGAISGRVPLPESIDPSRGNKAVQVQVRDIDEMAFGTEDLDLAAVEQIVETGQLQAIATAIVYAKKNYLDSKRSLCEILDRVMIDIEREGLDVLSEFPQGNYACFRRFELAAALSRLRSLRIMD